MLCGSIFFLSKQSFLPSSFDEFCRRVNQFRSHNKNRKWNVSGAPSFLVLTFVIVVPGRPSNGMSTMDIFSTYFRYYKDIIGCLVTGQENPLVRALVRLRLQPLALRLRWVNFSKIHVYLDWFQFRNPIVVYKHFRC